MKKRNKIICMLLVVLSMVPLAGCSTDATQPINLAYVLTVGVDKGKEKDFSFTFQIPYFSNEPGTGENPRSYTITTEAQSFADAMNAVNVNLPYLINTTHVNYIVFGEDLCKSEEGIKGFILSFMYFTDMNWTANVIACMGDAKDYIEGLQAEKQADLDGLQDNIMANSERTGFYPDTKLIDAYEDLLSESGGFACALGGGNKKATEEKKEEEGGESGSKDTQSSVEDASVSAFRANEADDSQSDDETPDNLNLEQVPGEFKREGGLGSDTSGAALFVDGKLVGTLDGHEARSILMITDEFAQSRIIIKNPFSEGLMGLTTKRVKAPKIVVKTEDKPRIDVTLYLQITSITHNKPEDYSTPEFSDKLKKHINTSLLNEIDVAVQKIQGMGCDPFFFAQHAAKNFSNAKDFLAYEWSKRYQEGEIHIHLETWITQANYDRSKEVSD